MTVLAIETSCDETAAAVVAATSNQEHGTGIGYVRVLSNVVASQADLHARTAGVVPEVAARAHVEAITFVVDDAIKQAGKGKQETGEAIDVVAVTTEPGLRPALVVGEAAARALAVAWDRPLVPVHHIAGHIAAAWIVSGIQPALTHRFPAVVLVVSGGHTQLWRLDGTPTVASAKAGDRFYPRLLGQTRDDAAGEAFDKIARLLGLSYPGGAALSELAKGGDPKAFDFPQPMVDSGDNDFSFSGLKTAVFYTVRDRTLSAQERADVAASAQEAIVAVLVSKAMGAAVREEAAEVILAGGVAANVQLRARLKEALGLLPLIVPHPQYCTDNAAMIGAAALLGVAVPFLASARP